MGEAVGTDTVKEEATPDPKDLVILIGLVTVIVRRGLFLLDQHAVPSSRQQGRAGQGRGGNTIVSRPSHNRGSSNLSW